jgi:hypothetical protein
LSCRSPITALLANVKCHRDEGKSIERCLIKLYGGAKQW